jgi:hypothetical protein
MNFEGNFDSKRNHDTVKMFPSPESASIGIVGLRLRAMYDDLRNEPVPARLLEVVQRFDRAADPQPRRGELGNGTES